MSEEIWKDVQGYEGLYQVSNFGRVKSLERIDCRNKKVKERILKQVKISGYWKVSFSKNGNVKQFFVHRLVAEAFLPAPENADKIFVGHKDEKNFLNSDECNNCIENLEWITSIENNRMPIRIKRLSGKNNHMYGKHYNHTDESKNIIGQKEKGNKKAAKKVFCENKIFDSAKECALFYNVDYNKMLKWLNGNSIMPKEWKEKQLKYMEKKKVEVE